MTNEHQHLRPPQPGAKVIGEFEWWIEEGKGYSLLKIQHRFRTASDRDPFLYPEIDLYGGWGKPVDEVTEAQIVAVFLHSKAVEMAAEETLGEAAMDNIFRRFYNTLARMSFAERLGLLMAPLLGDTSS